MPSIQVNLTLKQKIDAIEASKQPGFKQSDYAHKIVRVTRAHTIIPIDNSILSNLK